MLTLYLPFRGQPKRRPEAHEVSRWVEELERSQLISPLGGAHKRALDSLLSDLARGGPFGPERGLRLSPGLGVVSLFDQDAREQLLPAELSFEQLRLELAPAPTFLPLGDLELSVSCRHCGDELSLEAFDRALSSLALIPLEQVSLPCRSCDDQRSFKELSYDREVAFGSAWVAIEECGSGRLNPVLLKAWGEALGAPLELLVDQREAHLDWHGGEGRTLGGLEDEAWGEGLGAASYFEQGLKPSRALSKRRGKRGRGSGRGRARWEDL